MLVLRTQCSCACLCCNAAFRVACVSWLHVSCAFVLLACLCLHVCFVCDRVCVCFCMLHSCISYHNFVDYRCVLLSRVGVCVCACVHALRLRMRLPLFVSRLVFMLHVCEYYMCALRCCRWFVCVLVCVVCE